MTKSHLAETTIEEKKLDWTEMPTYSNTLLFFLGGKLKMPFLLHFGQENRPILSIREC